MTNHVDLLSELQLLEKVPSLERLRTAQKRRNQQLKKWAQYEKEMQSKKRKADKKKAHNGTARRRVSFATNVVLLEASARNDGNEVRYLLKNGVNPDLCNEDGLTALHQCCIDNYEGIVKILLNYGANVNPKDNELWTPLHAAATCGHSNLVKLLIQHGADMLAVNSDGNMPYDLCEDDPTLDMIETAMVNQGITQEIINETREAQERLIMADIQEIVQQHQDINQTDEQGVTLLHIAAANGYLRAVEILLEQGAKLDVQDSEGWQPLHAATFWGQVHVAELLVSHGANLMAKSFLDETPIDLCEDEEFRAILLDLKHKHDIIMKSHLKQKTSLCRRTSSTGSRGKVVRRASLSDRNNLYRKEYETEAIVWLGKTETKEADEPERGSDQENTDPNTLPDVWNAKPKETKHDTLTQTEPAMKADSNCQVPCNGTLPKSNLLQEFKSASCSQPVAAPWTASRDGSHQTLAELKRQRVAAKLSGHPLLNGHLSNGDENGPGVAPKSQISTVSSNGSALSYTVSSGEPPLLKLKQPLEVVEEKEGGCCSIS